MPTNDTIWGMSKAKRALHPRLLQSEGMQRCQLRTCQAACCLYGAWVDSDRAMQIIWHADEIKPHMAADQQEPGGWFDERAEADEYLPSGKAVHTEVLAAPGHYGGTACVFLRQDHKCALQVAAETAGKHPWAFKPFYCILHPLDLDEDGRITLDETKLLLDEPASCLRPTPQDIPLQEIFAEELDYLAARGNPKSAKPEC